MLAQPKNGKANRCGYQKDENDDNNNSDEDNDENGWSDRKTVKYHPADVRYATLKDLAQDKGNEKQQQLHNTTY